MAPDDADHQCAWRSRVEQIEADLAKVSAQLSEVQAQLNASKRKRKEHSSEKMRPPAEEIARKDGERPSPAATQKKRKSRAKARLAFDWRVHHGLVPPGQRSCPHCTGAPTMTPIPISEERSSLFVEYEPARFIGERRSVETLVCQRCSFIRSAPAAERVGVGRRYGPGFVAYLVTAKCADSIPIYRLAKRFNREGVPMARQTMNDLLHAAADELSPIAGRILELIREEALVQADETSMRVQRQKQRGFFWTFLSEMLPEANERSAWLIAYQFSMDRSGETPAMVLGGTAGNLVIDGYTGYNRVLSVKGRRRCACLAHVRRKFHDALDSARDDACRALELILDIYRVEHAAKARGIVGTPEHLALRRDQGRKAMRAFGAWLKEQRPRHLPKGPMGEAIRYATRHWKYLCRFLRDARIPVDNNASERWLRAIALGRKNYLNVGHKKAGSNLAVLYTLVATCEANGVNPLEYLRDVLTRVKTTPASKIDELLPHRWKPISREDRAIPVTNGADSPATQNQAELTPRSESTAPSPGDGETPAPNASVGQKSQNSSQGPLAGSDAAPAARARKTRGRRHAKATSEVAHANGHTAAADSIDVATSADTTGAAFVEIYQGERTPPSRAEEEEPPVAVEHQREDASRRGRHLATRAQVAVGEEPADANSRGRLGWARELPGPATENPRDASQNSSKQDSRLSEAKPPRREATLRGRRHASSARLKPP